MPSFAACCRGAGDIEVGVAALLAQLKARREQLYGTYGYLWASNSSGSASSSSPSSSSPARHGILALRGGGSTQARVVGANDVAFAAAPDAAQLRADVASSSEAGASSSSSSDGTFASSDEDAEEEPLAPAPAPRATPRPL